MTQRLPKAPPMRASREDLQKDDDAVTPRSQMTTDLQGGGNSEKDT